MGAAAMLGFDDIGRYQFRMIVKSLDKRIEAVFGHLTSFSCKQHSFKRIYIKDIMFRLLREISSQLTGQY